VYVYVCVLCFRHPEKDFFATEVVQKRMLNVLFVWSKLNPDVSYRQVCVCICVYMLV